MVQSIDKFHVQYVAVYVTTYFHLRQREITLVGEREPELVSQSPATPIFHFYPTLRLFLTVLLTSCSRMLSSILFNDYRRPGVFLFYSSGILACCLDAIVIYLVNHCGGCVCHNMQHGDVNRSSFVSFFVQYTREALWIVILIFIIITIHSHNCFAYYYQYHLIIISCKYCMAT